MSAAVVVRDLGWPVAEDPLSAPVIGGEVMVEGRGADGGGGEGGGTGGGEGGNGEQEAGIMEEGKGGVGHERSGWEVVRVDLNHDCRGDW